MKNVELTSFQRAKYFQDQNQVYSSSLLQFNIVVKVNVGAIWQDNEKQQTSKQMNKKPVDWKGIRKYFLYSQMT